MLDWLLKIATVFANYYTANTDYWHELSMVYGWASTANCAIALILFGFALTKRERPREAAVAVAQVIIMLAIPFIVTAAQGMF